jgi:KipI family sensor histidine kinase inhibitor
VRVDPLGESALILRDLPCSAPEAAARLGGIPGVVEAYAAFDTVGVILDGPSVDLEAALRRKIEASLGREHMIPVLYDGEDLDEVAQRSGLSVAEIVALHAREYECRAVGFCPGFAYLAPLSPPLDALPRRDSPRPRVAPRSVALAAGMTAVYPLERPGGWWIIGRTPLTLVDEADGYFPIRAGDRIRFVAIDESEYASRMGERL